ncbi:MAG: hypothetical protein EB060_08230 [Proteobacteria bacterium]|nr:hypothetical protein [Pseudomonadota bacterium]
MGNDSDGFHIDNYKGYHTAGAMTRIYGGGVNPDAVNVILQFAASGESEEISLLDYGCGYGRYIALAEYLGERGFKVNYVAYDPFVQALQQCEGNLVGKNYTRIGGADLNADFDVMPKDMSYAGPIYTNGNVTVTLLHGEFHVNPDRIRQLIGERDISLCMLGTLSHVSEFDERVEIMRMFDKMSRLGLIMELPNKDIAWKDEQAKYQELARTQGGVFGLKNPGISDIYYSRPNGHGGELQIYLHLYDKDTLNQELNSAGINNALVTGTTATAKVPVRDFAASVRRQSLEQSPDFMVVLAKKNIDIQVDIGVVLGPGRI